MDEEKLGHRLQAARTQAGLTQQALCQKANLSYSTLTKIERGAIKSPSIFTIQSIAGALGLSLDDLLGGASASRTPIRPSTTSRSGVRFVFFDINGCLVRFFHGAFTRLSEKTGASPDIIEMLFWHYNDQVCRGAMDMATFNRKLSEDLHSPEAIDWLQYYLEAVEPIPVMHELVRWTAEHYHVGLLTNIMPGFVEALMAKGLLPEVQYDCVVDSSKVGAIKPEAKMFEIAAKQSRYPAADILLVDDSRVNLMAAEKQGWHVLWFDDYQPEESAMHVKRALEPAE